MINAAHIIRIAISQNIDNAIAALVCENERFVSCESALIADLADRVDATGNIGTQIAALVARDLEQEDSLMDLADLVNDKDSDEICSMNLLRAKMKIQDLTIHPVVKSYVMMQIGHMMDFFALYGARGSGDWTRPVVQNTFALDKFDILSWHISKTCAVYYAAKVAEAIKRK